MADAVSNIDQIKENLSGMSLGERSSDYHDIRNNFRDFIKMTCEGIHDGSTIDRKALDETLNYAIEVRAAYYEWGARDANDISVTSGGSGDTHNHYRELAEKSMNRDLQQALNEYAAENGLTVSYDEKTGINSLNMDNIGDFFERGNVDGFENCNPVPEEAEDIPGGEPDYNNGDTLDEEAEDRKEGRSLKDMFKSVTESPAVKSAFEQLKKFGNWVKDLGNKALDKINDWTKKITEERAAQADSIAPDSSGGSNERQAGD